MIMKAKKPADYLAIRQEISNLQKRRAKVDRAPVSRDEALGALERAIENHGAKFGFTAIGLVRPNNPQPRLAMLVDSDVNPLELLAHVAPDLLRQAYTPLIDAYLEDHGPGLSATDRAAELARLDRAIFDLAVAEETAISRAEAESEAGNMIPRRHDADAKAFVAAHGDRAKAATKLRGLERHCTLLHGALLETTKSYREAADHRKEILTQLNNLRRGHNKEGVPRVRSGKVEPVFSEKFRPGEFRREAELISRLGRADRLFAEVDEVYQQASNGFQAFSQGLEPLRAVLGDGTKAEDMNTPGHPAGCRRDGTG